MSTDSEKPHLQPHKRGRGDAHVQPRSGKRVRLCGDEAQVACGFKPQRDDHISEPSLRSTSPEDYTSAAVLGGKLPLVLRWARVLLDNHVKKSNRFMTGLSSAAVAKRHILEEVHVPKNVVVELKAGDKLWHGDRRFWTNVLAFAMKLPSLNEVSNVLDAMRCYPSSVLFNTGVQQLFSTVRKHSKKCAHVSLPRPNVFSSFDCSAPSGNPTSMWFESTTYGRVQEIAVHISSVAEHVLCCAFHAREQSNCTKEAYAILLKALEAGIDHIEHEDLSSVVKWRGAESIENTEVEKASPLLQRAIEVAHSAVLKGLAISGRRYGLKRTKYNTRRKVQLWMMRRLFPEVMDICIVRLKLAISDIVEVTEESSAMDVDLLEMYLTRILRTAEKLYIRVGDMHFKEQFKNVGALMGKGTCRLLSSEPYRFMESRLY
ncbi:hypothetical protein BWQ96_10491 [Gracilariopsis chorda]|uniref:Uncharacterized protein n=1 Tax=Gracilariopsis chorda TaxID=448386 RepID=A0A2V3ICI1_9FLOR|nr:hypothetical protein BWQ96_10491 [Gracilariopsis chorda]|eukprot:PXF39794.1 hypothetical protein BWQ96_10491 [Gracilariopsis chorda]